MANPDEMVDIIDENDIVLRQTTKREAHEKGLLHRTSIGQIKDSNGRWLMVRQSPDKQDAGQYVSPIGGHAGAGESEDDALKREAMEECGIAGFDFKLIGKAIFNRTVIGRHENHYFIFYEVYSDKGLELNEEAVGYRFFTEQEMRDALRATPELFGASFHFVIQAFYPELMK